MSQEIKIIAIIDLKAGAWDHVAPVIHHCIRETRKEVGNFLYTAHFQAERENRIVLIERWENKATLQKHFETEHFKNLVKTLEPYLLHPMELLTLSEIPEEDV